MHLAWLFTGFHVDDTGAAADGAVLRVRLPSASTGVHEELFLLAAERARDEGL